MSKMHRNTKNFIKETILDLFQQLNIHTLPVDIDQVIEACGITLLKFSEVNGFKINRRMDAFAAKIPHGEAQYIITYNEHRPPGRLVWSKAHELGHITLGHLQEGAGGPETEAQAHYFASQLLMPLAVLDELGYHTKEQIAERCGVSPTAAALRVRDLKRRWWYYNTHGNTSYDVAFLNQFNLPIYE